MITNIDGWKWAVTKVIERKKKSFNIAWRIDNSETHSRINRGSVKLKSTLIARPAFSNNSINLMALSVGESNKKREKKFMNEIEFQRTMAHKRVLWVCDLKTGVYLKVLSIRRNLFFIVKVLKGNFKRKKFFLNQKKNRVKHHWRTNQTLSFQSDETDQIHVFSSRYALKSHR